MTGPEHYREAERLLGVHSGVARYIRDEAASGEHDVDVLAAAGDAAAQVLTSAQVHAMLALAAATALGLSDGGGAGMRGADAEAWERACSVLPVDVDEDDEDDRELPACGDCEHDAHTGECHCGCYR